MGKLEDALNRIETGLQLDGIAEQDRLESVLEPFLEEVLKATEVGNPRQVKKVLRAVSRMEMTQGFASEYYHNLGQSDLPVAGDVLLQAVDVYGSDSAFIAYIDLSLRKAGVDEGVRERMELPEGGRTLYLDPIVHAGRIRKNGEVKIPEHLKNTLTYYALNGPANLGIVAYSALVYLGTKQVVPFVEKRLNELVEGDFKLDALREVRMIGAAMEYLGENKAGYRELVELVAPVMFFTMSEDYKMGWKEQIREKVQSLT